MSCRKLQGSKSQVCTEWKHCIGTVAGVSQRLKDLARNVSGIQLISFQRGKIQKNSEPVGEVCLSSIWDVSADGKGTQNFPCDVADPICHSFHAGQHVSHGAECLGCPAKLSCLPGLTTRKTERIRLSLKYCSHQVLTLTFKQDP